MECWCTRLLLSLACFNIFLLSSSAILTRPIRISLGLETEEDFDKHFPVEVTTQDFVYNWSLRDERSKVNEVKGERVKDWVDDGR